MWKEILVHKSEVELHGDSYQIMIYCREDGRHFAQTYLSENDIIINDGFSLEEVLAKHEKLLPLAINSRKIRRDYQGFPGRVKSNRS